MTSPVPATLAAALEGRYRLERELGRGGMATVYLAHDVRHDREVAIKVLHPELGAALGSERFLSEIKTTARLQHPHILPLLDSGAADGLLFYVMPYVRGETLRTHLTRDRQLPIEEALLIAREVADALGAAHALGIIHRDIKPENILLQGGHALVADFGIALAVQSAGGARMTQTGLSLGTPQYMSPEQAMGERTIDARSDIYALGAVTYEMLGGDPPFTGSSVHAIVAKVLSERPTPLHTLRDTVPPYVEQAVLIALAKLPADRFATVKEFADALRGGGTIRTTVASGAGSRASASGNGRRRALVVAGIALAALSAAGGWLAGRQRGGSTTAPRAAATRFVLETRAGERTPVIIGKVFAISPDGSTLVYVASSSGRPQQLFRRRFDELEATAITGTSGATDPVFSPDGRWIAFIAGAQLVKVPLEGGTPIRLAAVPGSAARGLTWSSTGEIVFATNATTTLFALSQDGGPVREVFQAPGRIGLRWPLAIPESDEILFSWFSPAGDSVWVYAGSLRDGTSTRVSEDAYHGLGLLDGRLIYVSRTGDVMAAPYDRRKRVTSGPAHRVASGVRMSTGTGLAIAALSPVGDLVFRDGTTESQLVYVDAQGRARPALADTLGFENPRFSPEGGRIAVSVESFNRKTIWILERGSGILSRLGEDEVASTRDRPEWSPDGRRVLYRRNSPAGNFLVMRAADRSDAEARVPGPRVAVNELVMGPDGQTVLGRASAGAASSQDLWWWKLPDTVPHYFTESPEFETGPRFSPDGRWVAYSAETAGLRQVYVSPFPGPGGRVQVSRDGGSLPVWGPNGRTLYYPRGPRLMAASLAFTPMLTVTGTRTVLEGDYALDDPLHAAFDVAADGTILLVRPVREARTVVIRDFGTEVRNQLAKQGVK
jgi:serine/threonine-protein kinase